MALALTGGNVAVATFDPILPAPARDYFTFDFTPEISKVPPGSPVATPVIVTAAWALAVEPTSEITDPDLAARLIGDPVFDAYHTSQLAGDMLDGCIYLLSAQVTTSDGRILAKSAELICLTQREPAPPPSVDTGSVVFNYDQFISQFPAFAGANTDVLESCWAYAGIIFRNDATSPEQDLPTRAYLLYLLTAHIATIFAGPGAGGGFNATGMVGRINSKSVNGVSVSADGFPGVTGTQAWYLTTQYGAMYWRATAAYRTMHYFPGPQRWGGYGGLGVYPYYGGRRTW